MEDPRETTGGRVPSILVLPRPATGKRKGPRDGPRHPDVPKVPYGRSDILWFLPFTEDPPTEKEGGGGVMVYMKERKIEVPGWLDKCINNRIPPDSS